MVIVVIIRKLLFSIWLPLSELKVVTSLRSLNYKVFPIETKIFNSTWPFEVYHACGNTIQFNLKCSMDWKCLQRRKKGSVGIFFYPFNFFVRDSKVMAENWWIRQR